MRKKKCPCPVWTQLKNIFNPLLVTWKDVEPDWLGQVGVLHEGRCVLYLEAMKTMSVGIRRQSGRRVTGQGEAWDLTCFKRPTC